jgi:sigma-B regulation protein RsbU (phosphoserine phosphatase)
MVTGIMEETPFEDGAVTLEAGDRLVLFTDGITEARSTAGVEFDDGGLIQVVVRCRDRAASAIVAAIFDAVAAFSEGDLQDDATVMVAALA